jgi:hypothetical protein
MAEVELECAVYGEGTVFPVTIALDAKVGVLQEKIAGVLSTERHAVPPRLLTLYLARKQGEPTWVADDDNLDTLLQGDVDAAYKKMRPSWKLNKKELFGSSFTPGEEEIHVLVELPKGFAGGASDTLTTAQMVKEMHEQIVQSKRKRYNHSNMSSTKGKALLQELDIRVVPARSVPFATEDPTPVQPFAWKTVRDELGQDIKLMEEQQRERYRTYVEDNIGDVLVRENLCVLRVETGTNVLSAAIPGHDIDLIGRTDMLVLSDLAEQFPIHLELLPEVKMLIEVEKEVKGRAVFQALSELIALDVLIDDPVMALLTDLANHWQYFWISEKSDNHAIIRTVIIPDPSAAFAVIRSLLAQSPSADTGISLPCFEKPLKRRKLVNVLPSICERGESSDVRAAIERYYGIASVLGPDIEMARAVANQVTRSIPVFAHSTLSYFS